MKRIAIFSNLFPSQLTPNRATFNRQQFERLAKQYQVSVFVPVQWTEWFASKVRPKSEMTNLATYYFPYFYPPKLGRRLYSHCMFLSSLKQWRQLKNSQPDLLLSSWAYPDAVAGARLARRLEIPHIIKVHGSDVNMHGATPSRARQIVHSMAQASAVVCVSQALAHRLAELGVPKSKLHVIYNGVDQSLFQATSRESARQTLQLPPEQPLLLFIGNVLTSKGVFELLDAFAILARSRRHLRLAIAGDGADMNRLKQAIDHAGLSQQVMLLGRVDHQSLPQWINAASTVVLPSYNEGVPNVLLEAMACGTPVVATTVGGIPEVVPEQCGLLIPPQESAQLASALEQCLDRDWDRKAICQHGQSFNWDDNLQALQQLIEHALDA